MERHVSLWALDRSAKVCLYFFVQWWHKCPKRDTSTRSSIHDYFYPSSHRNNKPTPYLQPGDERVATAFEFHVELITEATLRIPTREKSKVFRIQRMVMWVPTWVDTLHMNRIGSMTAKWENLISAPMDITRALMVGLISKQLLAAQSRQSYLTYGEQTAWVSPMTSIWKTSMHPLASTMLR